MASSNLEACIRRWAQTTAEEKEEKEHTFRTEVVAKQWWHIVLPLRRIATAEQEEYESPRWRRGGGQTALGHNDSKRWVGDLYVRTVFRLFILRYQLIWADFRNYLRLLLFQSILSSLGCGLGAEDPGGPCTDISSELLRNRVAILFWSNSRWYLTFRATGLIFKEPTLVAAS